MDVDDDLQVPATLLEQLSCLQTLDHDDLVSQMLRLVGSDSLAAPTAKFYLEMSGWNVQAAVCAYFDLEAGPEARLAAPAMTFVKDVTIGEGEAVQPDTVFVKTWKVQNTGADRWPPGCQLRHTAEKEGGGPGGGGGIGGIGGGQQRVVGIGGPGGVGGVSSHSRLMTADGCDRVDVQSLMPWQMADISVEMRSPAEPGIFESKWRMSTASGIFFGDTIWVIITVERSGTLALTQQMNNFNALGSPTNTTAASSLLVNSSDNHNNHHHHNPFSPRKDTFHNNSSHDDEMK